LSLHCDAVISTHPDELVLQPSPKKSWIRQCNTGRCRVRPLSP